MVLQTIPDDGRADVLPSGALIELGGALHLIAEAGFGEEPQSWRAAR